ncbi:hypothetical protein VOLCADRAFT_121759 [Volvox carteri f. nagariensis]|uniref:Serine hydrolase domain-containing protein n=1 Tax=Volvox carteri f. nagariensis TaxID=3068 RepID=D8UJN1_VOLCA|nr:uncharacterized protein VOLCADRAFT_121759 [Volvox carteri f. nagariensis]EFJ40066.1 hypothetical protein VOLCADRAFT_121759 [Volvox carteri f. nagariensis]|eukprot:XP_002958878.1 hypothetical protein VOLCADRAFT_121759 [Volvox carteri f. nagariensis]
MLCTTASRAVLRIAQARPGLTLGATAARRLRFSHAALKPAPKPVEDARSGYSGSDAIRTGQGAEGTRQTGGDGLITHRGKMADSVPKLKLLCLHGYMQNAEIFRSRLGSMRKALKSRVEFVFVDAPFEAQGLPGGDDPEEVQGGREGRSWWQWTDTGPEGRPSKAASYTGMYACVCMYVCLCGARDNAMVTCCRVGVYTHMYGGCYLGLALAVWLFVCLSIYFLFVHSVGLLGVFLAGWEVAQDSLLEALRLHQPDGLLGFSQGATAAALLLSHLAATATATATATADDATFAGGLKQQVEQQQHDGSSGDRQNGGSGGEPAVASAASPAALLRSLKCAILVAGFLPRDPAVAELVRAGSCSSRVPLLLVTGTSDSLVPPERTAQLGACFNPATVSSYTHGGAHLVPTCSGQFKSTLVEFLDAARGRPGPGPPSSLHLQHQQQQRDVHFNAVLARVYDCLDIHFDVYFLCTCVVMQHICSAHS